MGSGAAAKDLLHRWVSGVHNALSFCPVAAAAAVMVLPCRFDDLPVAQLPASHDDPKIAAGLEVIRQLDEQLKEAWIKVGLCSGKRPTCLCGCAVVGMESRGSRSSARIKGCGWRNIHDGTTFACCLVCTLSIPVSVGACSAALHPVLHVICKCHAGLHLCLLQAQVSARGSNPEHWAAAERERLAARAAQLDEALARERQKRLHAARLLRALHKLDEQQQADDALLLPGPCKGLST